MAKLIVLLRVKDGMFFVNDWIACFEKLADEIVVLDNGSTDGTYEILKTHPKVVHIIRTTEYHEGKDKNLLYDFARTRKPDWCIWVDIDEIFEPQLTRHHFDKLMRNKLVTKFAFRRFHFIDRQHFAGSWFRLNYSSGHDRLMWKENPSGYFENVKIDSPNVKGIGGLKVGTNYRLKHLGYINKEIVDQKAKLYRSIIPDKEEILQTMYLFNERPIRWSDNRNSVQVVLLNMLLDMLKFTHVIPKIKNKLFSYLNL